MEANDALEAAVAAYDLLGTDFRVHGIHAAGRRTPFYVWIVCGVCEKESVCVCLRKKIRGSEMGDKEIVPATKDLAMNSR
jgi:hypothetical protein